MARISDSGRSADPPPSLAPGLVAPRGTPLYVHVPYCVVKCTYCDFFSVALERDGGRAEVAATLDALVCEIDARAPEAPETVFVGGGTPTFLEADELVRLFEALEARTGFRGTAGEVTVECNPESLTPEKARLLRTLGATRLSIGIQSLDPRVLSLFGRPHRVEDGLAAVAAARAGGFDEISVDLIYAVPGQGLERWLAELEEVLAFGPRHVSAYSLAFEEGTVLTKMLGSRRIERLPEELELAFFQRTRETLKGRGYDPYEVSNFCLSGHRCAHNENYWRNGSYLGVGPGAVSQLGATRFGNPRSVDAWRGPAGAGRCAASWEETLTPARRLGETWWLGLRTRRGVEPEQARRTAGFTGTGDPAEALARALASEGYLTQEEGAYRLTDRGLPLTDHLSGRFLDPR